MTYWAHPGDPPPPPVYTGPPKTGHFPGGRPPVALNAWPAQYPVLPQSYAQLPVEPRRPVGLATSAVLGYLTAALLLIAGATLASGTSLIDAWADASGQTHNLSLELDIDAIVNLLTAGLLIAGGVGLAGDRLGGRVLLTTGNGLMLAESLYWTVRWSGRAGDGVTFWAVLFAAAAAISLALSWLPGATTWLRTDGAPAQTEAPGPETASPDRSPTASTRTV